MTAALVGRCSDSRGFHYYSHLHMGTGGSKFTTQDSPSFPQPESERKEFMKRRQEKKKKTVPAVSDSLLPLPSH